MAKKIVLHYFDIPGRAEPIRQMLNYKKIAYEDRHIPHSEWRQMKVKYPFKMVPVLQVDETYLVETVAIVHYAGAICGLKPQDELEDGLALAVLELVNTFISDCVPYMICSPDAKQEEAEKLFAVLTPKLKLLESYMEKHTKAKTHVVGTTLTYADFILAVFINLLRKVHTKFQTLLSSSCPLITRVMESMSKIMT